MGLESAPDLETALQKAYAYTGAEAKVTVIPNGAGVFMESQESKSEVRGPKSE